MTHDKIKYHLGETLFNFLGSCNIEQLAKQKQELLKDINLHSHGSEILFKRTLELQYINYLLQTN